MNPGHTFNTRGSVYYVLCVCIANLRSTANPTQNISPGVYRTDIVGCRELPRARGVRQRFAVLLGASVLIHHRGKFRALKPVGVKLTVKSVHRNCLDGRQLGERGHARTLKLYLLVIASRVQITYRAMLF